MLKMNLWNEDARKAFAFIGERREFFCDAMPTGRIRIDSLQDKYDAKGELIELFIVYSS